MNSFQDNSPGPTPVVSASHPAPPIVSPPVPNKPEPVEQLLSRLLNSKNQYVNTDRQELDLQIKDRRIMIVDDEEINVFAVRQHLKKAGYSQFLTCVDAREAFSRVCSEAPDIVLLDIQMPHINGLEILHAINQDSRTAKIPVVMLTAESDPRIKTAAMELGANDFLTKPVDVSELKSRVRNALTVRAHLDEMGHRTEALEEMVKRRTQELYDSRRQIILSLARAAEHRDNETGNHVIRVGFFAAIIARQLGWKPDAVEMIQQAAQLHDVGKIGIPDQILFKPGKLDDDEYSYIKRHCAMGKKIISPYDAKEREMLRAHVRLGEGILHIRNSPLMMMAARIAQTHHEHWDGRGYPLGLAGEDIPIEGRITAVADVYDALSSKRPYKDPFPREKCFRILEESRGTHFDPVVLDAFFDCSKEIIEIQMAFMDE